MTRTDELYQRLMAVEPTELELELGERYPSMPRDRRVRIMAEKLFRIEEIQKGA